MQVKLFVSCEIPDRAVVEGKIRSWIGANPSMCLNALNTWLSDQLLMLLLVWGVLELFNASHSHWQILAARSQGVSSSCDSTMSTVLTLMMLSWKPHQCRTIDISEEERAHEFSVVVFAWQLYFAIMLYVVSTVSFQYCLHSFLILLQIRQNWFTIWSETLGV